MVVLGLIVVLIIGISLVHGICYGDIQCRTRVLVGPSGPDMCLGLMLTDAEGASSETFSTDDTIMARISMRNVGQTAIVTPKGFSTQNFHLRLFFYAPDGKLITTKEQIGSFEPPPPPVEFVNTPAL